MWVRGKGGCPKPGHRLCMQASIPTSIAAPYFKHTSSSSMRSDTHYVGYNHVDAERKYTAALQLRAWFSQQ